MHHVEQDSACVEVKFARKQWAAPIHGDKPVFCRPPTPGTLQLDSNVVCITAAGGRVDMQAQHVIT